MGKMFQWQKDIEKKKEPKCLMANKLAALALKMN